MWDQKYGCAKQYRCSIAYYLMSYLSTSYQIVLDRAIDTPGHGKDVVDGFNAVHKLYLATFLRMSRTPEKVAKYCFWTALKPSTTSFPCHPWYKFHHEDPVNAYIIWKSLLLPSLSWIQHA